MKSKTQTTGERCNKEPKMRLKARNKQKPNPNPKGQ